MKVERSNCNRVEKIKIVREEALERALAYLLKINDDSYDIHSHHCPRCNGKVTGSGVESKDLCRIRSW